ncbi:hypothetical protein ACFFJB_07065 [Camelimonas abortus]|uniref:Lipoprotein n=1 Tax=Camelimonas abortus TaxID=1017184 RepID=A0ABV7LDG4_9HYPH
MVKSGLFAGAAAGALLLLAGVSGACAGGARHAVPTWDHPLDVRHCRRVAQVSPPTPAQGGFGAAVAAMRRATLAAGGTDLELRRHGRDWSVVTGVAWDCSRAPWRGRRSGPAAAAPGAGGTIRRA